MTMRCIAIDDEPLALKQITNYISKTPFLELSAACSSAPEASGILATQEVDLLLVDINMPDLNGLDFVKSLRTKPLVIFTTAYSEYAIEGFRVDALDYLLKPISYADFLRSAEKAYRQYQLINNNTSPASNSTSPDRLFVKSEYKMVQIIVAGITHIESRGEYLRIYSETGTPVMTLGSMKSMEEKLSAAQFMRVHRSYIVNLQKIAAVERSHITLTSGAEVPIGEQYKDEFRNYLNKHSVAKG